MAQVRGRTEIFGLRRAPTSSDFLTTLGLADTTTMWVPAFRNAFAKGGYDAAESERFWAKLWAIPRGLGHPNVFHRQIRTDVTNNLDPRYPKRTIRSCGIRTAKMISYLQAMLRTLFARDSGLRTRTSKALIAEYFARKFFFDNILRGRGQDVAA